MNNEDGGEANPDGVKINMTENSDVQDSKISDSKLSNRAPADNKLIDSKINDSKLGANSKLDPKVSNAANSNLKVTGADSKSKSQSKKDTGSKFSTGPNKSGFGKAANKDKNEKEVDDKKSKASNLPSKNDEKSNINQKDGKKSENDKNGAGKDGKPGEKDKDGKDKAGEEKKDENVDDFENQRTQKLMNSKDNNRKIVVFQFVFMAIIFIIYFVLDYILELQFLDDVRQSFSHLQLISQRPAVVKYTVVFTIEQIATATIQMQNSQVFTNGTMIDVRDYYTNFIYDNERDIFESMTKSFPSNFDTYQSVFELYNYDDLCANYYKPMSQDQSTSNSL